MYLTYSQAHLTFCGLAPFTTFRPEAWSIRAARSTERPMVFTITTGRGGPEETLMMTVEPGVTGVPGAGVWSATMPVGRSRVGRRSVWTLNPAASSTFRACVSYWPPTSGSGTVSEAGGAAGAAAASGFGGSGAGKGVIGLSCSAASITLCQIWAGHVPPYTVMRVVGGCIVTSCVGKPTHTPVDRSGV